MIEVEIFGVSMRLLPRRAIYLPEYQALLVADVHAGKAGHFQRAGIPIPKGGLKEDLDTLRGLIDQHGAKQLIFLGDLFHSRWNAEFDEFAEWRGQCHATKMVLVRGNHEIYGDAAYLELGLTVHADALGLGPLMLSHAPSESMKEIDLSGAGSATDSTVAPRICGHIHPGRRIRTGPNFSELLPCFFLSGTTLVLPAFGSFTGLVDVAPAAGDRIWICTEDAVINLPVRSA